GPLELTIVGLPPDSHCASWAHTSPDTAPPPPLGASAGAEGAGELLLGAGATGRGAGRGLVPTATISATGSATVTNSLAPPRDSWPPAWTARVARTRVPSAPSWTTRRSPT